MNARFAPFGIAIDELVRMRPQQDGKAHKLLDHIDEHKAWAYVLHDVCGYDLREVAEITESTISAAQTRLVRGRRELRARLEADTELSALLSQDAKRKGTG